MQGSISQEPHHTEIYRKNAAPQNRGAGLVRACAVEMQVNISQEPLDMETYKKNAVPRIEPRTQTHTLCEPTESNMQGSISQEPHHTEIYRKNAAPQNRGAGLVRACAVEMQVNISQELLDMEIYRKNAAPRIDPRTQTHTLCASLIEMQVNEHFRRAILYGNL